jgi:hypothetical protein
MSEESVENNAGFAVTDVSAVFCSSVSPAVDGASPRLSSSQNVETAFGVKGRSEPCGPA